MIVVKGSILHYYDKKANNNKFYRAFYYPISGGYRLVYVWGRENTTGQKKIETYTNEDYCRRIMERKLHEKVAKGYQSLGSGEIEVADAMENELSYISDRLAAVHGKAPNKSKGSGYSFLIIEQELPEDLLARLMS